MRRRSHGSAGRRGVAARPPKPSTAPVTSRHAIKDLYARRRVRRQDGARRRHRTAVCTEMGCWRRGAGQPIRRCVPGRHDGRSCSRSPEGKRQREGGSSRLARATGSARSRREHAPPASGDFGSVSVQVTVPRALIDSHCHIAGEEFVADLPAVVERARAAGVSRALVILAAEDDAESRGPARAERVAGVPLCDRRASASRQGVCVQSAGGGRHGRRAPGCAARGARDRRDWARLPLRFLAARRAARGVSRADPPGARPRPADRDSHARSRRRHAAHPRRGRRGRACAACFTALRAIARPPSARWRPDSCLSIPGVATFPKAEALRQAAAAAPADRLLVETDSPYLAPIPVSRQAQRAGLRRESRRTARRRARRERPKRSAHQTDRNFDRLFRSRDASRAKLCASKH